MDALKTAAQLTLNIGLRSESTLQNFYGNAQVAHVLNNSLLETNHTFIYLWGETHSGRTHLAQAYCHQAEIEKLSWMYLPLREIINHSPAIFEALERYHVLVLDDLNLISGKIQWEEAVFHLYNRGVQTKQHLLVTSNCAPAQLDVQLPDLLSRLKSATIFKLQSLTDAEKRTALTTRAQELGWQLSPEVGEFLLTHYSRDINQLFVALDKLDAASLQAKRRVTIPFVKEILG